MNDQIWNQLLSEKTEQTFVISNPYQFILPVLVFENRPKSKDRTDTKVVPQTETTELERRGTHISPNYSLNDGTFNNSPNLPHCTFWELRYRRGFEKSLILNNGSSNSSSHNNHLPERSSGLNMWTDTTTIVNGTHTTTWGFEVLRKEILFPQQVYGDHVCKTGWTSYETKSSPDSLR